MRGEDIGGEQNYSNYEFYLGSNAGGKFPRGNEDDRTYLSRSTARKPSAD